MRHSKAFTVVALLISSGQFSFVPVGCGNPKCKARNTKQIQNTDVSNAELKWKPDRMGGFHGL